MVNYGRLVEPSSGGWHRTVPGSAVSVQADLWHPRDWALLGDISTLSREIARLKHLEPTGTP